MKATIVEIQSGSRYTDGKRRVTLRFGDADAFARDLRVTEEMLGRTVQLDDEVEFAVTPVSNVIKFREEPKATLKDMGKPLPTSGDEVIHGA